MAEVTSEVRNGRLRHYLLIKCGERLKLCRCNQSKTYPFCDETHKTVETEIGPTTIECQPDCSDNSE